MLSPALGHENIAVNKTHKIPVPMGLPLQWGTQRKELGRNNIIADCNERCTENKQSDEINSKWVDIHVGRERIREGLSEQMTWKLRLEEEWKPRCEEPERVF